MFPGYVCSKPKRGNSKTPVRMSTPRFITTGIGTSAPSNDNVNMQRGSQTRFLPTIMDNNSVVLEELREFRSVIVARMTARQIS